MEERARFACKPASIFRFQIGNFVANIRLKLSSLKYFRIIRQTVSLISAPRLPPTTTTKGFGCLYLTCWRAICLSARVFHLTDYLYKTFSPCKICSDSLKLIAVTLANRTDFICYSNFCSCIKVGIPILETTKGRIHNRLFNNIRFELFRIRLACKILSSSLCQKVLKG